MTEAAFWPDGARLVLSISMQFEAGGEVVYGAPGPLDGLGTMDDVLDYPTKSWYRYGYVEGLQRMMDLWDRLGIKVTSHMVGSAVDNAPEVAREIVERGHEAAAHGRDWVPQYDMEADAERAFIEANVASIEKATGTRPLGYNSAAMRPTANTLKILSDLGFTYHIDDVSRDEPFVIPVRDKPFAVVPYTLQHNDIIQFERYGFSAHDFERELKDGFDQLYEEAAHRRRMMSISLHDRIGGRPHRVRAIGRFLEYALAQPGVVVLRKDEIAAFALCEPSILKDPNEHDRWADIEDGLGKAKVGRMA